MNIEVDCLSEDRRRLQQNLEKANKACDSVMQKNEELKQELKHNENLLEQIEKKFDDQHSKIMVQLCNLNVINIRDVI